MGCELRVMGCELRVAGYGLRVAGFWRLVTGNGHWILVDAGSRDAGKPGNSVL